MHTKRKPIVILLAEDDPDDQLMVKEALEENLIINNFYIVEDGVELMDYLKNKGKYSNPASAPRPGIILLDLNMPRKDGREALQEIKEDPDLCTIPVIVLTTSKVEEDILRTYNIGASSFITKPVSFEGLVEVMKILKKYWFEIVELPGNKKGFLIS
ncbi:Response regulator rcp1 [subsurface metagenome]